MGARVIKVETPGHGDDTRGWGPPFVGPEDDPISTYYLSCNRNKESVALDLKSEDGRDTLTRLVRHGDVLIENFRPGVLDRLGFPTERLHEINPRLVILSISGFGHDGPEGGRAGYDQIAQGEGGLMSLTGSGPDDPQRVGVPIGDLLAGMYGAYGVTAALHERERTGRGRVVRTSLLAAIVGVHAFQGTRYTVAREVGRLIPERSQLVLDLSDLVVDLLERPSRGQDVLRQVGGIDHRPLRRAGRGDGEAGRRGDGEQDAAAGNSGEVRGHG